MHLAKKMGKEANQNYDALKSMLPNDVQEKVNEIESLRNTDPQKYKQLCFQIHKNALVELKKDFNKQGIKTEEGILVKTLNYLGKFLTSTAGTISGAIIIPLLIHKLGFNPLPIFPSVR
jgi:hypothetical protein